MKLPTEVKTLRKYLQINRDQLEIEAATQADIYFKVSEAWAIAISIKDQKKEELAQTDALLDKRIRETWPDMGPRMTENTVANQVINNKKHKEAFKAFNEAKANAELLTALKEAFEQRGRMIRDLVALYTYRYYSETDVKTPNERNQINHQRMGEIKREKRTEKLREQRRKSASKGTS